MPNPKSHQRNSAILLLIGSICIWLATQFIGGDWRVTVEDTLTLALLVWLYTGSNSARWITGILCSLATLIAWAGGFYFYVHKEAQQFMNGTEYLSILFWAIAALIYPIVAYRLIFRRKPSDTKTAFV